MPTTSSSACARALLAVTLLLPAGLIGACSVIGGDGCHGTDAELKRLAAQPLLGSAPAGATAPVNYRGVGVTTGCDGDSSGKPWLHADRLYAFPGSRDDVIAHYTRAAAAAGWDLEPDPVPGAPPATVKGACWTKTEQGRHLQLTVGFDTDVYSPAPKVVTGIAYEVSVGSLSDGSGGGEATCG